MKEAAKKLAIITSEMNQPKVKQLVISIEWKKSRTWGSNPSAKAEVTFYDKEAGEWKTGFYRQDGYTCSGCGYDKESTVIAQIFNQFLKYKLYDPSVREAAKENKTPYGFYCREDWKHFDGGVGTNCYYRISEFLGGKFEHVASGKTFDVYKYSE